MSLTRQLMTTLRTALGSSDPLPPVHRIPPIPAPPARVYTSRPERSPFAARAARHTTALVGIGHVGTRYATDVVLQFQAELAVAHEAVSTELPEGWAEQHGFVGVKSRVTSHREFLLRPDLGRRLDDASLERVRSQCQKSVDVQLIVADGLSAVACIGTGKALHDAVSRACQARGLTVGTPIAARFARVWLEDEIGEEVGAKVAMILLGERPGLGTGDGLSAYVVHGPRVGNTDGDRNMISNIHMRGITPDDAAGRLAAFATAMIEQQTSGVSLDLARLGAAAERGYRAPQERRKLVSVEGRR
ncbi:MAG: ethanolamine ammonia-lyase subunit EutC [Deltaproteobacteria bacterium]|nr:ethanolamine ammonia-lyase subunit EutC [Deltaproteobacteria bacterium]